MAYGKKAPSCDPLTFCNDEIKVFMNTENIEVSQYVKLSHLTHFCPWDDISSVSSHGQKLSQMTQLYILTHFDVFCEEN